MAENIDNNDKNLENSTNHESEKQTDLNPPVVETNNLKTKQERTCTLNRTR